AEDGIRDGHVTGVQTCALPISRNIYIQDSAQYKHHVQTYGHPSKFGHKDICRMWHGREFDADHLIQLYKKAGAKYFMSMGVHHRSEERRVGKERRSRCRRRRWR